MAVKVPEIYRKSPDLLTTVSFLDTVTGIGYIKFYLAGATSSAGNEYFLTTDATIISDESNNTADGTGLDLDFDITIGRPFIIADEKAIINSAQNTDTGTTQTVTWTIRHVDGVTETDIGTTTGATISGSAGNEYFLKTTKVSMTRKRFTKGQKLRINFTTVSNTAFSHVYFDPSGLNTQTTESPSFGLTTTVLIPVEVDI